MPSVPPPLRVALVSMHTSPVGRPGAGDVGGMNVVVRHVAEHLGAQGHTVEIFTRRSHPSEQLRSEHSPGVILHHLPAGPAEPRTKRDLEQFIAPFADRLAGHGPWDVIHSHHWFSGMSALPIAQERGIAHVQSFHSIAAGPTDPLGHGERPEGPGRVPAERQLAVSSDAVVAVSRAEADTVVHRLGAPPDRVRIVHPGVDTVQFRPATSRPRGGRPVVLAAARLEPLKGLDLAIAAVAGVPAARRPLLVVAGAPTAGFEGYEEELTELARSLGVLPDVRFTGPLTREDLAHRMRTASAVLVPSHSETYGLVALEAAASGVPVIAARTGGLPDAIADGVTGILLPDRDPGLWAATIDALLADPGRSAELGRAGRAHALRRSWADTADAWLEVYRVLSGVPAQV